MKKILIVLLALFVVFAMLGCDSGTPGKKSTTTEDDKDKDKDKDKDEGEDEPVLKSYIIRVMGDFDLDGGSPKAQKTWALNGTETNGVAADNDFEKEDLIAAKYLIVEIKDASNKDGFGGFDVHIQSNGNSWGWSAGKTELTGGWLGYSMAAGKTYYIVIDLTTLVTYSDFISDLSGGGKLSLAYYNALYAKDDASSNIGFQEAYLAKDTLIKPSGSTDQSFGYITTDIVIWEE